MLILVRKIDRSVNIYVGDQCIKVTLLGIERDRAKLGFTASSQVNIVREEIDMHTSFPVASRTEER